jgi:hypothetical protein
LSKDFACCCIEITATLLARKLSACTETSAIFLRYRLWWAMAVVAGNLLVLQDGRIGFIDFGIVGKIPPTTWLALQSLAEAFPDNNFDLMARLASVCFAKCGA